MEYSVIPLKAIIDFPILDYITSQLNISWPWTNIFMGQSIFIGLPVMLITVIGLFKIEDKTFLFFINAIALSIRANTVNAKIHSWRAFYKRNLG